MITKLDIGAKKLYPVTRFFNLLAERGRGRVAANRKFVGAARTSGLQPICWRSFPTSAFIVYKMAAFIIEGDVIGESVSVVLGI